MQLSCTGDVSDTRDGPLSEASSDERETDLTILNCKRRDIQ
jgi:hypothetical protein